MDPVFSSVEIAGYEDLEEILALQKIAFISEAILCGDFTIPPLVQTIEELKAEYQDRQKALITLKIVQDRRIVGSVRAYESEGICYVSRLMVHPDYQRKGLGKRLMEAIEVLFKCVRFDLFTGEKSVGDIRFYERQGYTIYKTQGIPGKAGLVYLEKCRGV